MTTTCAAKMKKLCGREGAECECCEEASASERIKAFTAGMSEEELLKFYEDLLEMEGLTPQ